MLDVQVFVKLKEITQSGDKRDGMKIDVEWLRCCRVTIEYFKITKTPLNMFFFLLFCLVILFIECVLFMAINIFWEVLDDVNTLDQLNALCGSHKWFGSGSRIIITTRDRHILSGNRVNKVFKMKYMDENESIELFSWHAFKQASPTKDFAEISRNVVEYSGGLPLALEILGSYLFDRGLAEWKSALAKLKRIPNNQVQKKLRISYDALNDDTDKEIFLDIACFFIGMDRNDVTLILNGCGLFAEIGISILVERSLITVDDKNKLGMHDLLRDMGREIIREKSPEELEERCRLWFHDDVLHVLSEQIVRIFFNF